MAKKVLIVGLGRLGGGIAAASFFASRGFEVTVSDKLTQQELSSSVKKLQKFKNISFKLGTHNEDDFKGKDLIIFNQAVPATSPLVKIARKQCDEVHSELTYFLSALEKQQGIGAAFGYVAITGTRGKTTTTTWIGHLLKPAYVGGNIPTAGLFKLLEKLEKGVARPVVLELSSFQLEYMRKGLIAPHVAVITNLSPDHLNRHGSMEEYLRTKAQIFAQQTAKDFLVLNADSPYTKDFIAHKPKAQVYFISAKKLPPQARGLYLKKDIIMFKEKGVDMEIAQVPPSFGVHERYNLLGALLAAHLYGASWSVLLPRIQTLPAIHFREEEIYAEKGVRIINDSAATSPEGTMAAIEKFNSPQTCFIIGGTDKQLDFTPLASLISKKVSPQQLYLLEGSGTAKLIAALAKKKYNVAAEDAYGSLQEIVEDIAQNKKWKTIVLSPSCASFEKFKNEFHRGRVFNGLVKKHFPQSK